MGVLGAVHFYPGKVGTGLKLPCSQ
ncbi:hypothetical protein [Pseudarthrobacter sp. NPDC080039]